MADEEKKDAVVDGQDNKSDQKVYSEEEIAKIVSENEDLAKRNEELNTNLASVAAERENYKTVALSKKGKNLDDEDLPLDERIARVIDEKLSSTKEAQLLKEKDDIVKRLAERNKELTVALKNRAQIGTRTGGSSEAPNDQKIETKFWTEDQLAYFKKHGIDPNKTKENYLKIKNQK